MQRKVGLLKALFVVMILCGRFEAAAQSPIELTAQAEDYLVEMPMADYRLFEVQQAGETFTRVVVDGLVDYGNIGQAILPQYSFRLAIGDSGHKPAVRILSATQHIRTVEHKILPRQTLRPKRFLFDRTFFEGEGNDLGLVTVSDPFRIRGVQGVTITIRPFLYVPSQDQLIIRQDIRFLVDLAEGAKPQVADTALFDPYLKAVMRNYEPPKDRNQKEGWLFDPGRRPIPE